MVYDTKNTSPSTTRASAVYRCEAITHGFRETQPHQTRGAGVLHAADLRQDAVHRRTRRINTHNSGCGHFRNNRL